MICYDCMGYFKWLVEDKGFRICQRCYGKRYHNWKKRKCPGNTCSSPTLLDLKKKWERK